MLMELYFTLQGTNISPQKWHFEDDFPFPVWWDMLIPWRVITCFTSGKVAAAIARVARAEASWFFAWQGYWGAVWASKNKLKSMAVFIRYQDIPRHPKICQSQGILGVFRCLSSLPKAQGPRLALILLSGSGTASVATTISTLQESVLCGVV